MKYYMWVPEVLKSNCKFQTLISTAAPKMSIKLKAKDYFPRPQIYGIEATFFPFSVGMYIVKPF